MCTYLAKRGSTYYFRRPIPKELQAAFHPKTEWMISLRTKDRAAAKELLPALTQQTNREMRTARMMAAVKEPAPALAARPKTAGELAREQAEHEHMVAQEAWENEKDAEEHAEQEKLAPHLEALDAMLAAPSWSLGTRERAIVERIKRADFSTSIERDARIAAKWQLEQAQEAGEIVPSAPTTVAHTPPGEPVKLEPLLEAYADEHGNRAKRG